jgi:hypothetical protein
MKLNHLPVNPSKHIYLNPLYHPFVRLFLYLIFLVSFCVFILLAGVSVKVEIDARSTQSFFATSTVYKAQTLTAFPTNTSTPTPTLTPTFTVTPSPTITPTPTATPALTWSKSIVDAGGNEPAFFLSMDINPSGKYYIAYFLDRIDQLMVVEGNGKSWKQVGNLSQLNKEGRAVGFYINLDIGLSETPNLTYLIYDKNLGRTVGLRSDGKWDVGRIEQSFSAFDMRIIMDSSGVAHHAILTKEGAIYYQYGGGNIELIETGILSLDLSQVSSIYFPIALAVDSVDNPHLCFTKNKTLVCTIKNGSNWIYMSAIENGVYPSLQIDESGNWHLAYFDYIEKSLKYAYLTANSSSWEINEVDSSGDVGWYPSLKIDNKNFAHISYYDAGNSALKYALGRHEGWSIYTIDNDGNVGLTSSLVLDLENRPAIAYYDAERRRILFVLGGTQ